MCDNNFSSDEQAFIMALDLAEEEETNTEKKKKNNRRFSIQEIYTKRVTYFVGEYHTLFKHLIGDDRKFFQYFRMSYKKFLELLNLIEPHIKKKHPKFGELISSEERLAVTMR